MAELILTAAEKEAETYLELDDASVGKIVKHLLKESLDWCKEEDPDGYNALAIRAFSLWMIEQARKHKAGSLEFTITGVTKAGQDIGDWKVTIKKMPDQA